MARLSKESESLGLAREVASIMARAMARVRARAVARVRARAVTRLSKGSG